MLEAAGFYKANTVAVLPEFVHKVITLKESAGATTLRNRSNGS